MLLTGLEMKGDSFHPLGTMEDISLTNCRDDALHLNPLPLTSTRLVEETRRGNPMSNAASKAE
jgi:hypothetical protein